MVRITSVLAFSVVRFEVGAMLRGLRVEVEEG
jgi:hypothetical protein